MYLITGCGFGLEGARALSEALKGKTKLITLYLWGLTEKGENGSVMEACFDENEMTGNKFGDEGARALCDVIRANTALNDLNLGGQLIPTLNKNQKSKISTPSFK